MVSRRFTDLPMSFHSLGSLSGTSGGGAALADVLVGLSDAAASARGEIAPHALARDGLAGCRILGGHLRPVAVELLGDHLRQTGERALSHLGAGDPDYDRVVRADDHPR